MNSCLFMGRIAADPDFRTTPNGTPHCAFRIAVQRRFKDANGQRQADFIACVAWRQSAEYVSRYLKKGDLVAVRGELQNRQYQAQDGTPRYITEIIVDEVRAYGSSQAQNRPEPAAQPAAPIASETVQQVKDMFGAGFVEVNGEDDLPF